MDHCSGSGCLSYWFVKLVQVILIFILFFHLAILVFIVVRKRRREEPSGYSAGYSSGSKKPLHDDYKPIVRSGMRYYFKVKQDLTIYSGEASDTSQTVSIRSGTEV